jgi:uncharacterized protein
MTIIESKLDVRDAAYDFTLRAGEPWLHEVKRGQIFRILDLEGNQAVDTLFYSSADPLERYSAQDTIRAQMNLYLSAGTVLMSNLGNPLLTIIADTLGGACAAESNTVRYSLDKLHMHNCRDNFLHAITHCACGAGAQLTKRDIVSNINFFMNVPVTPLGKLTFEDGISAPGKYVEMRAEMDVTVLISNCPQLNNPCNGYNPTPARLTIWEAQ